MNESQKLAAVVLRLIGFALLVVSVLGPLYVAVLTSLGQAPTYPKERWLGSVIWFVMGAILMFVAKPIGRWLGRGLD